jgi:hypothetical protein
MASYLRDFARSLRPGRDHLLAAQLEQSAQERKQKKERKAKEASRAGARAHKRSLPPLR